MSTYVERYPLKPPIPPFADDDAYELAVRSQAGAEELLAKLGVVDEIREAVLGHCEDQRPTPKYRPQLLKERLKRLGWIPEVRVPPFRPEMDDMPINERYDMLKFFESDRSE